jgi:hypothetical protein
MAIEFKKVYPSDYARIKPLLAQINNDPNKQEKYALLFQKHWNCSIDFCGVMVEDDGEAIAYLGVIFSERIIQGKKEIFGNLTTLVINEKYRGQKLTHRIIQYLQALDNFSLTAITPIPSLYNMYKTNGFKEVSDYRTLFWKNPFAIKRKDTELITDIKEIENLLSPDMRQILNDHRKFNCCLWLFKKDNETTILILKEFKAQRRKFITQRLINYFDWALRKFLNIDMLSPVMSCYEIHFCNNYAMLLKNFKAFAAWAFSQKGVCCISIRQEQVEKHRPKYWLKNKFYHSRQMFYSNSVPLEYYDTLYSEIFVLDM